MFKSKPARGELLIPPDAKGASDGLEVVRLWIANGGSHVSINPITNPTFPEGQEGIMWGVLLADIAKHASHALTLSGTSNANRDELLSQMAKVFFDELGIERKETGSVLEDK